MRTFLTTQRFRLTYKGFSMMELVIVLAIMGIVGSMALPLVSKKMEVSRNTRAQADIQSIGTGITQFYQDLGRPPDLNAANQVLDIMISAGIPPTDSTGNTWFGGGIRSASLDTNLLTKAPTSYLNWSPDTEMGWHGPYLNKNPVDPWGNQYVVNVNGLNKKNICGSGALVCISWVLSAGTNSKLDTTDANTTLVSDDVGIVLPDFNNITN